MTVRICMRSRGPYVIERADGAEIEVLSADGTRLPLPPGDKVRLCRCAASWNAPFCDGSHHGTRFEAPAAPEGSADG
jgi:CDGSH-type Zn-finger protein